MKKILLFTVLLFAFFSALSAQITHDEADKIVSEYMTKETQSYTLYAKESKQENMTVTTINDEKLKLDYACWVYYINYIDLSNDYGRYLFVNESNGNLLEVNSKDNEKPDDLAEWRRDAFVCGCEEEYFYYYHDEKIFINHRTDMIDIKFTDDINKDQILAIINSDNSLQLSPEVDFLEGITSRYAFVVLESKDGKPVSQASIEFFKKQPEVLSVTYILENMGHFGGFSDEFIVRLRKTTSVAQLYELAKQNNCKVIESYDPDRFFIIVPKTSSCNSMQMENRFYETGLFEYTSTIVITFDSSASVDPYFTLQWALKNTVQSVDIKAEQAWGITKGNSGIHIAVFDKGVDLTHPDLQANLLPGYDFTGENSAGAPILSDATHGTSCAGIIGAIQDNGKGISGVSPSCKIIPVRIQKGNQLDPACAVNAFNWAWQNGVDVISNSWISWVVNDKDLENAIYNAVTHGRAGLGCVVVFGSGNEFYHPVSYPAKLRNVIAAGAISNDGLRADFSSHGDSLDVVAPGVNIYTTSMIGDTQNTVINDGSNGVYISTFTGTSAAAPHVAGVAALILSANPALTGQQVRNIIESSCQKINQYSPNNPNGYTYSSTPVHPNGTWNSYVGHGLVNAFASVQAAQAACTTYTVNFANQTVNTNTITASCGTINTQNVTVTNNASLRLIAPGDVTINNTFDVQLGSELEIK